MREWPNRAVSKTVVPVMGTVGSNPTPSAAQKLFLASQPRNFNSASDKFWTSGIVRRAGDSDKALRGQIPPTRLRRPAPNHRQGSVGKLVPASCWPGGRRGSRSRRALKPRVNLTMACLPLVGGALKFPERRTSVWRRQAGQIRALRRPPEARPASGRALRRPPVPQEYRGSRTGYWVDPR
jgi:hypothetical protein